MISRGCLPYDLSHASRGLGEKRLLAENGRRTKSRCPPQWLLVHGQQTRTDYWGLLGKDRLLQPSSCLKAGHQSLSARVEAHEHFGSGFWPYNLTFLGLLRCLGLPRFRAGCSLMHRTGIFSGFSHPLHLPLLPRPTDSTCFRHSPSSPVPSNRTACVDTSRFPSPCCGQRECTDSKGHVALSDVKTLLGSPSHLRAEPRLLARTFRVTFSKPLPTVREIMPH